jgi:Mg/Co/Ni transporter MgtE
MGLVFKYGILAFMGIIAMIVVAIGFLKLAGAMSIMAKAQQSHQITMDVGKDLAGASGGLPGPGGDIRLDGSLTTGEKKDEPAGESGEQEKVVFGVRLDQVFFLVHLLSSEDPANVALVATHLMPEVRNEFLRQLPPEMASDVLSNMAKVRFVEPDVVNTIKEELERRLGGTVGGVQQVIDVMEKVNLRAKRDVLEKLAKKDPETARLVRRKILLPEDISLLSERDMSVLVTDFKIETLASALWELPEPLKELIKKQMAVKTWQMVEQTMKYGTPSREASEKAVEELVELALKLIREGRIANPLESEPVLLAEPEINRPAPPGAAAVPASAFVDEGSRSGTKDQG